MVTACRKAGVKIYRRRGDQPHHRAGQHLLRRARLHAVQLPGHPVRAERLPRQERRVPLQRRRHPGLQQQEPGLQLQPGRPGGPRHRQGRCPGRSSPAYLNKLLRYGVSGFRVDAAKHVGAGRPGRHLLPAQQDQGRGRSRTGRSRCSRAAPASCRPQAFTRSGDVLGLPAAEQIKNAFRAYTDRTDRQPGHARGVRHRRRACPPARKPCPSSPTTTPTATAATTSATRTATVHPGQQVAAGPGLRIAAGLLQLHLGLPANPPANATDDDKAERPSPRRRRRTA